MHSVHTYITWEFYKIKIYFWKQQLGEFQKRHIHWIIMRESQITIGEAQRTPPRNARKTRQRYNSFTYIVKYLGYALKAYSVRCNTILRISLISRSNMILESFNVDFSKLYLCLLLITSHLTGIISVLLSIVIHNYITIYILYITLLLSF